MSVRVSDVHSRTNPTTRPAAVAIEAAVERVVLLRVFDRRRHKRAVTSRILKLAHDLPPPPDEVLSPARSLLPPLAMAPVPKGDGPLKPRSRPFC